MDVSGIMKAGCNLVDLAARDKFVSKQVTKQPAEKRKHPCLHYIFLEKPEFWLLVTRK